MNQRDPVAPASEEEWCDIIRGAAADRRAIEVVGAGTKRGIGYPSREAMPVSTRAFVNIIDYDPAELVLTVGAGVPLTRIETLLDAHEQMLAFEPMDFSALIGESVGSSTIGGVVAAGFAGPRRVSAGNVRDHLLGFSAVSGNAEIFKAGGRVVKNVTGFDLSKLMAGSWGQLAVLTQLTLKVLPKPRMSLTLEIPGLDDSGAMTAMIRAMRSQCSVAAAAYIPEWHSSSQMSRALLRLEGFGPSVAARAQLLTEIIGNDSSAARLDAQEAQSVWSQIRSATVSGVNAPDAALWRFCIPVTSALSVMSAMRARHSRYFADWGGGLVWACLPSSVSAGEVRGIAEQAGGHATLVRAPDAYRLRAPALHPDTAAVTALSQRVKAAFDAAGVLDPERFAGCES